MTVSPRRAQDGQQPKSTAQPAAESTQQGAPELPPTLFTLRNLNPAATASAEKTSATGTTTAAVSGNPPIATTVPLADTAGPPQAAKTVGQELPAENAQQHAFPVYGQSEASLGSMNADAEPEPTLEMPAAGPSIPDSPHPTRSGDQPSSPIKPGFPGASRDTSTPAGRTWMERIGSHALVLSMLLIVVAAALWTGRNNGDSSQRDDSVAADTAQQIEFDRNLEAELPILENQFGSLAETDSNGSPEFPGANLDGASSAIQPPDVSASSGDRLANDQTASVPGQSLGPANLQSDVASSNRTNEFSSTAAPASPEFSTSQQLASQHSERQPLGTAATDRSASPGVTLNQTDANTYATSEDGLIAKVEPNVETNQFFQSSQGVEATTVSNRTVLDDEALSVPTLEELESSSLIDVAPPAHRGPHFSRTPFGITDSDMFRHLNEMIERNSRGRTDSAARGTTPSN